MKLLVVPPRTKKGYQVVTDFWVDDWKVRLYSHSGVITGVSEDVQNERFVQVTQ